MINSEQGAKFWTGCPDTRCTDFELLLFSSPIRHHWLNRGIEKVNYCINFVSIRFPSYIERKLIYLPSSLYLLEIIVAVENLKLSGEKYREFVY